MKYWIKPLGQGDRYTSTDRKGMLRFMVHTMKITSTSANNLLQVMENDCDGDPLEVGSSFYEGEVLSAKVTEQ